MPDRSDELYGTVREEVVEEERTVARWEMRVLQQLGINLH